MNLPFVSIRMHREVVEALQAALDAAHETSQILHSENLQLRQHYFELRISGANPALPALVPQRLDDVTQAVNTVARGDKKLRASMMAQVEKDRRAGFTDLEIVDRIQRGAPPDTLEEFVS